MDGLIHLAPTPAVFEAMIKGGKTQQTSCMFLSSTIKPGLDLVRRFGKFVDGGWLEGTKGVEKQSVRHLF